jgi:twinkle protein
LRKYWEKASAGDRFVLLDHKGWGSDINKLKNRIRYMAKSLGCKTIVLDHLHIALSSVAGASGDWSGIDELVTELCTLAIECDICLHLVSHVSGERSLRGSKGISKLVDALIFLERDRHNEDIEIANTTSVIVDKNRFAGDVGIACYLRYDRNTGRMTECQKPENAVVPEEF